MGRTIVVFSLSLSVCHTARDYSALQEVVEAHTQIPELEKSREKTEGTKVISVLALVGVGAKIKFLSGRVNDYQASHQVTISSLSDGGNSAKLTPHLTCNICNKICGSQAQLILHQHSLHK
eukprot:sb/3476064/